MKLIFKNHKKELRTEILESQIATTLLPVVQNNIAEYVTAKEAATTIDKAEVAILKESAPYTELAQHIIFSLLTIDSKPVPVQSLAGMLIPYIYPSEEYLYRTISAKIALDLCFHLDPLTTITVSPLTNLPMIKSNICNEEYRFKTLYPFPNKQPSTSHKNLGSFKWTATTTEAVDKLNKLELTYANLEEYAPASTANEEQHTKFAIRQAILDEHDGSPFYIDWHQDYRYRMYAGGYHVNPQGSEYEKTLINFHKPEMLTAIGEQQLKKSIAAAYGLGKKTDAEKLEWFEANEDRLALKRLKAKEPYVYKALIDAWEANKHGAPINTPIELDATNSQLQMVAVLTKSANLASYCNVINNSTNTVADAYQSTADIMNHILDKTLTRGEIKKAHMISGYGAGNKKIKEQLEADLMSEYTDSVFDAFKTAEHIISPEVDMIKQICETLWDKDKTEYNWTLPDGARVQYKPNGKHTNKFKLLNGITLEITYQAIAPSENHTPLFVNIIHSVDAYVARQLVVRCSFPIIPIHDGFRCHPNYAHIMKATYADIMAEIADSDLLANILSEALGKRIDLAGTSTLDLDAIRDSSYCIS